jgi:hypothetical protein
MQNFGRTAPRECEIVFRFISVIASAAKQTIVPHKERMDCFAPPILPRKAKPKRRTFRPAVDDASRFT